VNWPHFGLYFTSEHVAIAQKLRDQQPFDAAWNLLHERGRTGAQAAQWAGFRYRFENDSAAGEEGVKRLLSCIREGFSEDVTFSTAIQELLIHLHAFEMLRDHASLEPVLQMEFTDLAIKRLAHLNELAYEPSYVEALMRALLNLVSGIVFEQEAQFQYGVDIYEQTVREDIHPQGYIQKAVQSGDGGGLYRQFVAVQSLALMAEAASHVGVNLWDYSFRGVSLMTAFAYIEYYYYFPEKWRWDTNATNQPFREYGGFLEMVYRRSAPQDLKPILDALRPIYDAAGGGLTTLSHGSPPKKRGLFT
jgi:hypothetical protein